MIDIAKDSFANTFIFNIIQCITLYRFKIRFTNNENNSKNRKNL